NLAGARTQTSPAKELQTVTGPEVRRKASGKDRKVSSAAGGNLSRMHKTQETAKESRLNFMYSHLRNRTLASAHKCLRICDLCQELAFGTQRGLSQSCNSYNSFVFIVLWRQFLERCCCEMSASASRRDNTDRSLARSAWE